jgi:DNA-binding transcriptional LysR family regulator
LFEHTGEGLVLTAAGDALLVQAEAMEQAAERVAEAPDTGRSLSGLLRISVSEGFGTWYIADRLHEFTAANPNLVVDLVASSGFLNPSKRETDLAIMLGRPVTGNLVSGKLIDYELGLYASVAYLERVGEPATIDDLRDGHPLVGYVPELLYAPQLAYLNELGPGLEPRTRSTSINAQYRAIAAGSGVGVLPYFIGRADRGLKRILPQHAIQRSFWTVTHRDTRDLRRVRAFQAWLAAAVTRDRSVFGSREPIGPT